MWQRLAIKLLRWLFFTVVIALAPILCCWHNLGLEGRIASPELLLGKGELYLISCALAAAAIGELVATGWEQATAKVICAGGCLLIVVLATSAYAVIAGHLEKHDDCCATEVASRSKILFICTIVAAAACLTFPQRTNENG
jgi:hypothetical protein